MTDLILPEHILCDVEVRSKKRGLEVLSALLAEGPTRLTAMEIFSGLNERERLGSTNLGNGAAIPHDRDPDLAQTITGIMVLSSPIEFDRGKPEVDIIFGVLVGDEDAETVIADITEILGESELLALIRRAESAEDIGNLVSSRLSLCV